MFKAVKNENGLMVGFISIEYIKNGCDNFEKSAKNLDKKANRIMGALAGQKS